MTQLFSPASFLVVLVVVIVVVIIMLLFLLVHRLSAPLTPAKRSRDRRLDGASQGGSTLASPSQRLKTETTAATSQSGAAAAAKAAAGPMPGDDLPPVLAPPGRSAVMHVFLPAWHLTHLPLTCSMDIVQLCSIPNCIFQFKNIGCILEIYAQKRLGTVKMRLYIGEIFSNTQVASEYGMQPVQALQ